MFVDIVVILFLKTVVLHNISHINTLITCFGQRWGYQFLFPFFFPGYESESESEVAQLCPTLFMGYSRQEYWSGLPFPSPEDLPHPGIKARSPALQADSLLAEP